MTVQKANQGSKGQCKKLTKAQIDRAKGLPRLK